MVWQIVRDNIRASDLVVGDMDAQVAAAAHRRRAHGRAGRALRAGHLRRSPATALMDHAERLMRAGDRQAARRRLSRRDGDRRLSRQRRSGQEGAADRRHHHQAGRRASRSTSPARRRRCPTGRSTCRSKAPPTSRSGSPSARCCSTPTIHGHIPVNAGLIRPITIVAPKGCLANPTFPAPTIARFCPGNQLADTVMKALARRCRATSRPASATSRSSPSPA